MKFNFSKLTRIKGSASSHSGHSRCGILTAVVTASLLSVASSQELHASELLLKRLDPAEGVVNAADEWWEYFESINVVFDQVPHLADGGMITLEHKASGISEEVEPNMMFAGFNMDGYTVLVNPSEAMKFNGEYTMTIPAGIFTNDDGEEYAGGTFTWTLTGLEDGEEEKPDETPLSITGIWLGVAMDSGEKTASGSAILCVDPATAITLQDGITLSAIRENDALEVVFNHSDKAAEASWRIYDVTADEGVMSGWMQKMSNGHFTMSPGWIDIEFFKNHEYTLTFHAYNKQPSQGRIEYGQGASLVIYGDTEEFTFSDIYHIGTFPTPESFEISSIDDNRITMVFSDPVIVDEEQSGIISFFGMIKKFEQVIYDRANPNVVVLVIPHDAIASASDQLLLSVAAYDYQGHLVEGNNGIDGDSRIEVAYTCNVALNSPRLTGNWHRVADTSCFRVKSGNSGYIPEYINDAHRAQPYLADQAGTKVASFDADYGYVVISSESFYGSEAPTELEFRLVDSETGLPFNREGNYVLVIPRGTFECGTDQYNHYASKKSSYPVEIAPFVDVDYVVSGHLADVKSVAKGSSVSFAITPAEGWVVDKVLLNDEDIKDSYNGGMLTTPVLNENSVIEIDMTYDAFTYIPTGVDDVFSPLELRVWSENGEIHVAGLMEGQTVDLYGMNGAHMFTRKVMEDGEARISVPSSQTYILIVADNDRHVAVKISNN